MTIEEAIAYLMPIYEAAQLSGYKAALGTVLAAAREQQSANYRQVSKALQDNGSESLNQLLDAYRQMKSIQQEAEKNEPLTLEDLKQLGTVEIARRAAIEELISPAGLSPSSGNVMERCFGMDKMLYKLYKYADGTWSTWGTYSDPLRLARAANELGRMGLENKVEAVGTRDLSEAGEC